MADGGVALSVAQGQTAPRDGSSLGFLVAPAGIREHTRGIGKSSVGDKRCNDHFIVSLMVQFQQLSFDWALAELSSARVSCNPNLLQEILIPVMMARRSFCSALSILEFFTKACFIN